MLIFLLSLPLLGLAQELNHVKFISQEQYLMDRVENIIMEEQTFLVTISIVDQQIIMENYGREDKFQVLKVENLPSNRYHFHLENNQTMIMDEKNVYFFHNELYIGILYEIKERIDLD